MKKPSTNILDIESSKISEAKHHDPFAVLGRQLKGNEVYIKVYMPYAETIKLSHNDEPFQRIIGTDFFDNYNFNSIQAD